MNSNTTDPFWGRNYPRQAPPRRDFPASAPIVDLAPHRIADAVIDNDIRELDPDTRDFIRGVGWGCLGGSAFWIVAAMLWWVL